MAKKKAKKNKGGRPTVLTAATVKKLEAAYLNDASDAQACLQAGISRQTLYNYEKKNPKFIDRKKALRDSPKYLAKKNIVTGLKSKNLQVRMSMTKWYAETKMKDEYSKKQEVAVYGDAEKAPVQTQEKPMTLEESARLYHQMCDECGG